MYFSTCIFLSAKSVDRDRRSSYVPRTFLFWMLEKTSAAARQNQQSDLCAQQKPRSAWASIQSDQSLCCALSGLLTLRFFMQTAKTLITLGDFPADLSLRWAHSVLLLVFVMLRLNYCHVNILHQLCDKVSKGTEGKNNMKAYRIIILCVYFFRWHDNKNLNCIWLLAFFRCSTTSWKSLTLKGAVVE